MDKLYIVLNELIAPLVPLWLSWRRLRGKEDNTRLRERFGYASIPRPAGVLVWLHAASVGEATSILPLISALRARYPKWHILLTTGTKTSADLMQLRLPQGVMHQYVPVDTREATWRFMRHWRPDVALFVESEFWPNLVMAADAWQCFMAVVNGRMSERSFRFWNNYPSLMRRMLGCFNLVVAQSEDDAARFRKLEAKHVSTVGNLKYDGEPLPSDDSKLLAITSALGGRPAWLAASTHPGEETLVALAHAKLKTTKHDLLTIIVPRHPTRGGEIAAELQKKFRIAIRSRGDKIKPDTEIYIADTLGELGLFYRAVDIVFMGGSLVPHGGQNPLEPARLASAIITGPYTHNFSDIYRDLESHKACLRASDADKLAALAGQLLTHAAMAQAMQDAAKAWVENQAGATHRLMDVFEPIFTAQAS